MVSLYYLSSQARNLRLCTSWRARYGDGMGTLAPLNPYSRAPFDLLEAELRNRLSAAFDRFASAFDPQCELSIGDEMRLKRWLNASLPHTVQTLRESKPNRQAISQFARQEGIDPQPKIRGIIYEGGRP
jgi:hypothetical protein